MVWPLAYTPPPPSSVSSTATHMKTEKERWPGVGRGWARSRIIRPLKIVQYSLLRHFIVITTNKCLPRSWTELYLIRQLSSNIPFSSWGSSSMMADSAYMFTILWPACTQPQHVKTNIYIYIYIYRIRIHWVQMRIRIQGSDDQKLNKKFTAE